DAGDDRQLAVGCSPGRRDDGSYLLGRQRHVFAVAARRDEEAAARPEAAGHHVADVVLRRLGLQLEIVAEGGRDERTGTAQALPNGFPIHGMSSTAPCGRSRTQTETKGVPDAREARRGPGCGYLPPSVTRPITGSSMAPS